MQPERTPAWYLYVLLKNRRFLVLSLILIMVPTVIVTYLLKKKYTVTTVIMPPESSPELGLTIGGMGLSEFAGYFSGGMGFSLPLMTTLSDVYVEMLNSRTLVERVILSTGYIDSVDQRRRYDDNPQLGLYWARRIFRNNYSASVNPSGFIEVKVTTGDPLYSVLVSERVVEVLDSLNVAIGTSRAHATRLMIERRLEGADSMLAAASESLTVFQGEWGVISPEEEITQLVATLAQLKQQYLELTASAAAIGSSFGGGGTTAALELERRAGALLGVIRQIESGTYSAAVDSAFPSLSLTDYPRAAFEYARLRSDYEMALRLSSTLRISLQQAITDESSDASTVRLLDAPAHPGWKSKPRKIYIWLEVFGVSLLLLLTFIFTRERVWRYREANPEQWREWQKLLGEVRSDFRRNRERSPQPPDTSARS
jgi:capsule polysaccharide export protein KpsE/RkpR